MNNAEVEKDARLKIWKEAFNLGIVARNRDLPKVCNLNEKKYLTPSGQISRVCKVAWEQGWEIGKNY